ncbi:hypothetical protein [Pseudoclavibacter albus]|uniref:hypothetical protein n=1 Tax=Pseudoclavibacter albus TaxID=272241 RepID=UPI0008254959|nr:hypothetical protein [Pseudoclavibacter alba]
MTFSCHCRLGALAALVCGSFKAAALESEAGCDLAGGCFDGFIVDVAFIVEELLEFSSTGPESFGFVAEGFDLTVDDGSADCVELFGELVALTFDFAELAAVLRGLIVASVVHRAHSILAGILRSRS